MELWQLEGFRAFARHRNFTAAAREIHRTQPAVFQQVRALETELDKKLYENFQGEIRLTPDGERLADFATSVLDTIRAFRSEFTRGDSSRRLSVAASENIILYLLPKVMEVFKQRFGDVDLRVLNRKRLEVFRLINEGEIDFGITSYWQVPPKFDFYDCATFETVLITPPSHPLARKRRLTLRDIATCPLVLPERGSGTWTKVMRAFEAEQLEAQVVLEAGCWELIKRFVEGGLGVSIVNSICLSSGAHANVEVRSLSEYFDNVRYGVAVRQGKYLSSLAREFILTLAPGFEQVTPAGPGAPAASAPRATMSPRSPLPA
jgi:DNA-binding transcriptional LysR family regulator